MRRCRSSVRFARITAVVVALACAGWGAPAWAQGGLTTEGAAFLLVPVGARTVGTGQAVAAVESGTESLWGNPAGIARMTQRDVGFLFSRTFAADGTTLGIVYPAGAAGVLGFGAQLYDYGVQDNTDLQTGETIGQIIPRAVVLSATYAATLGNRLRAGLSYKLVQSRLDCSGPCGFGGSRPFQASTNAVDGGLQYVLPRADSLTIGLTLRSAGLKLQISDNPQSDPLPSRLHLGASGRIPALTAAMAGTDVRWTAEIVSRASFREPSLHLGGELDLQHRLFVRAGYVSGEGEATGPAIGLGFVRGKLRLDFARVFSGISADLGVPPTFLTLRVQW